MVIEPWRFTLRRPRRCVEDGALTLDEEARGDPVRLVGRLVRIMLGEATAKFAMSASTRAIMASSGSARFIPGAASTPRSCFRRRSAVAMGELASSAMGSVETLRICLRRRSAVAAGEEGVGASGTDVVHDGGAA